MSSEDTRMSDYILEDVGTGEKFLLDRNESTYKCGRKLSNKISSQSILTSREHCIFYRTDSGLGVTDLGSANGTYVNGLIQKPYEMTKLNINDLIGIGYSGALLNEFKSNVKTSRFAKPTVYRLKSYVEEEPMVTEDKNELRPDLRQLSFQEITKNTMGNNQRLRKNYEKSEDSPDFKKPCIIFRVEEEAPFTHVIDVHTDAVGISPTINRDPRLNRNKSIESSMDTNVTAITSRVVARSKPSTKRVSFNDLTTKIKLYEIDPGKTMKKCPPKDVSTFIKRSRKRNIKDKTAFPKLEQFLSHIFSWLKEEQLARTPSVIDEKKLLPMSSKYETYQDYYNVLEPLLTLQLWHEITRNFQIGEKKSKNLVMCSIVDNLVILKPKSSMNVPVTTLVLEILVSKRDVDVQAHPLYGDLVSFEYASNSRQGHSIRTIFAYVTNFRQTVITPFTLFNRDLLNFVKEPYAVLTYTVITKSCDLSTIQTNRVHGLRKISHLSTNMRMIQALQYLPISPILNKILHPKVEDYQLPVINNIHSYSVVMKDKLNAKQLEAVVKITDAVVQELSKICLIQGPPGSGKSKVIVNLVAEILYGGDRYKEKKNRILVCAASNAAVDEIVLRLLEVRRTISERDAKNRFKMIRLGCNEMIHPRARTVSLTELTKLAVKRTVKDYMSQLTDDTVEEEKRVLQAKINGLELELLSKQCSPYPTYIMKKLDDAKAKYNILTSRQSAKELDTRELINLQKSMEETLIAGADVIACTLGSCYTSQMESVFAESEEAISVCIVDEATRCAEAETLLPLIMGVRTLVLVGDTIQVPPTIQSQKAEQLGLNQSLFARIQNSFNGQENNPIIMLDSQYRVCPIP